MMREIALYISTLCFAFAVATEHSKEVSLPIPGRAGLVVVPHQLPSDGADDRAASRQDNAPAVPTALRERLAALADCVLSEAAAPVSGSADKQPVAQRTELPGEGGVVAVRLPSGEKVPQAQELIRLLQRTAAEGKVLLLQVMLGQGGEVCPAAETQLERFGVWRRAAAEALDNCRPVPGLTLPEGWYATLVGEDTYLFPPPLSSQETVHLRIPAHEIDTVVPTALHAPDARILIHRVEEPGEDEPHAFMQLDIPACVWQTAPEQLPVLKLQNAQ